MMEFDYSRIDELLHNPIRLAIVTALSQVEEGNFKWLKQLTQTTDGNLATHLRKLEDRGYISVQKTFVGRRPASFYRLTDKGHEAFLGYLDSLKIYLESVYSQKE